MARARALPEPTHDGRPASQPVRHDSWSPARREAVSTRRISGSTTCCRLRRPHPAVRLCSTETRVRGPLGWVRPLVPKTPPLVGDRSTRRIVILTFRAAAGLEEENACAL